MADRRRAGRILVDPVLSGAEHESRDHGAVPAGAGWSPRLGAGAMTEPTWRSTGAAARAGVTGVLLVPRAGARPEAVPVDRELMIGRGADCDVVLASGVVSRHHARVWPAGQQFGVEDLGSRNGTSINGRRIVSASELQDGDRLTLGDVDLEFGLFGSAAVPPVPRQPATSGPDADRGPTQPVPASASADTEDSKGVGAKRVSLAILESLVATALSQAIGTSLAGTYAFAIIAPLLGTVFALRKNGRMRVGAVLLVTAIAVTVTVVAVTAADVTLDRSVFPWSDSGRTFVPPPDEGTSDATQLIMPKLVGETNVAAMQLLSRYGFDARNVLIVDTPSSRGSFGKVVRTSPRAGAKVPDNAIVRIFIGTGGDP